VGHFKIILKISQLFQGVGKKANKLKQSREQKRIRQVAELVREREAARKRRAR
jgi:hypothetical protein